MTQDNQTTPDLPLAVIVEPTVEAAHHTDTDTPTEPAGPTDAKPPRTSGWPVAKGFIGGLLGGLAVAALAAVALTVAWPRIQTLVLGNEDQRLGNVERALDEVNSRIASVERNQSQNAGADTTATIQALAQRVTALEAQSRTPATDPRIGAVAEQSDRLAADIVRLEAEIQSLHRAIPPEGTILRLAERAESAEKEARVLASQHASAQALLLVVGQLRDAVDRGDSYQAELLAARRVATPDETPALDALTPTAPNGVPRRDALAAAFPTLSADILRAAALPAESGFWQRAFYRLTSLVSIRRMDGQGAGTPAVIARTEIRIKEGNLAKAAQELSALQGEPLGVASPWIQAANARVSADRALSELSAAAAAHTAQRGDQ
jgi:hypothetical protein